MKSSGLLTAVVGMILFPTIQATWCNFYYDSACTKDANGGTSFDCNNNGIFGSGGGMSNAIAPRAITKTVGSIDAAVMPIVLVGRVRRNVGKASQLKALRLITLVLTFMAPGRSIR